MISQEYLKTLLLYKNGKFYWKLNKSNSIKKGQESGCNHNKGYRSIKIDGKSYLVHRLVYLYHNGFVPKFIDHIDGNRSNNEINNLRETNKSTNNWNSKMNTKNSSGVKGVSWDKRRNKWIAQCRVYKILYYIGAYDDLSDAKIEITKFRELNHKEFANHGQNINWKKI